VVVCHRPRAVHHAGDRRRRHGLLRLGRSQASTRSPATVGLRWKFTTGNIIDAAAALDRSQRTVTIGSGDQNLYQLRTDPRPLSRPPAA